MLPLLGSSLTEAMVSPFHPDSKTIMASLSPTLRKLNPHWGYVFEQEVLLEGHMLKEWHFL